MISNQSLTADTQAILWVDGERVDFTTGFSYSSDVLQLGDPFSVTVPNPKGKCISKLRRGGNITLYLSNPSVNGGTETLKAKGIIVQRRGRSDESGTVVQVEGADLGWHLQNNNPPLWYNLQKGTFGQLLKDLIDPSWGIQGIRYSNEKNRQTRLSKLQGRRGAEIAQADSIQVQRVFTEPGDKVGDILLNYARRLNLLLNVSCDGYLQAWLPDYDQAPLYRLDYHDWDDPESARNNVLSAEVVESIDSVWTDITVVGTVVGWRPQDPNDPHPGQFRGTYPPKGTAPPDGLPFKHRLVEAMGEVYKGAWANPAAEWRYRRGLFDAWSATYVVRGHEQNGYWWESDTLCEVHDSVHGVDGTYYVSSVRCDRSEQGDRTTLTLRKPNLLTANFRGIT